MFLVLYRVLRAVATLLIVASIVFVIIRLTGDPVRAFVPEGTPSEIEETYRQRLGLDRSLPEQYFRYLAGLMVGDFGQSFFQASPALQVVAQRIPATLQLAVPSFLLSTVLGLTIGIAAALSRGSRIDRLLSTATIIAGAVPSFALAVVLVLAFSVTLRWLPSAGSATPAHMVLPTIAMAVAPAAILARMTRASMSDALALPALEHARALGLPLRTRILSYALPNAMLPLLTVLGLEIAYLIAGSSVVEVLFGWPGIGRLFVQAADRSDYAVVQCIVILITTSVVIVNLLTDIAYRLADPRLRSAS